MNQLIRPHTTQPKQRSLSLFQQLISRIDEYQDKPRPQTQSRQRPKLLAQTLMKKMSQIDSYDPSEPVYERLFPQPQVDERFRLIQVREKALRTKSAIPRSRIIYLDEEKQQKSKFTTMNNTQTPVLSCVMKPIQDRPRLLGRDYLEKYVFHNQYGP